MDSSNKLLEIRDIFAATLSALTREQDIAPDYREWAGRTLERLVQVGDSNLGENLKEMLLEGEEYAEKEHFRLWEMELAE